MAATRSGDGMVLLVMDATLLTPLLPTLTAMIGLIVGLLSPLITNRIAFLQRRSEDQREQCDAILSLFRDVNVFEALTEPAGSTRRALLLLAVRLRDEAARDACSALVAQATGDDVQESKVLDSWSRVIQEVARVYRSYS